MKKLLLIIGSSLLCVQYMYTQTVIQGTSSMKNRDVLFGPKVGFALTQVGGEGLISNGLLPGFQLGAAAEIPISDEFYFAPEILFSFQGMRGIGDHLRLGYLNIPLMGKYHITDAIAVELGPQLGVLVTDNGEDFNLKNNTIDLSLGAGGGYRLTDSFYFQLRLNMGFLKVIEDVEATNRAFQIAAIYYLY